MKRTSKQAKWAARQPMTFGVVIRDPKQAERLTELRKRYGGATRTHVVRLAIDFLYEHGDPLSVGEPKLRARAA